MKTQKLLFWCGVAYAILLTLVVGAFPLQSSPRLFLLGVPLFVISVIIARNLSHRSTIPSAPATTRLVLNPKENPVEFLSGQIRVAASASDSYFENVIRTRLRELLISKLSAETGWDRDMTRLTLLDPSKGMQMLANDQLYSILYGSIPKTGAARVKMIEEAIDQIGGWKG